jgi:hypothetical protein
MEVLLFTAKILNIQIIYLIVYNIFDSLLPEKVINGYTSIKVQHQITRNQI